MGFRRRGGVVGTTSLAIVVPGQDGVDPKRPGEKALTLGQLVGNLKTGAHFLYNTPEDRRNIAKPVKPLSYGAFGSYAPSYDSTFATISKEESSLIFSSFETESVNAQTERLLNYAKENDYALVMADSLLGILSSGGGGRSGMNSAPSSVGISHGMSSGNTQTANNFTPSVSQNHLTPPPLQANPESSSIATLTKLDVPCEEMVDCESSNKQKEGDGEVEENYLDKELSESWTLLGKLYEEQTKRLSLPNPPNSPSNYEMAIVDRVTRKLSDLAKSTQPGTIAPLPAIRKAMRLPSDV